MDSQSTVTAYFLSKGLERMIIFISKHFNTKDYTKVPFFKEFIIFKKDIKECKRDSLQYCVGEKYDFWIYDKKKYIHIYQINIALLRSSAILLS